MTRHQGVIVFVLLAAGWLSSAGVLASPPGTVDEARPVSTVAQLDDESAPADSQVADDADELPMTMSRPG